MVSEDESKPEEATESETTIMAGNDDEQSGQGAKGATCIIGGVNSVVEQVQAVEPPQIQQVNNHNLYIYIYICMSTSLSSLSLLCPLLLCFHLFFSGGWYFEQILLNKLLKFELYSSHTYIHTYIDEFKLSVL